MHRLITNEPGNELSETDKKAVTSFIITTYAESRGEKAPQVVFYQAEAKDHGYHTKDETGQSIVGINTQSNAFLNNPAYLVNVGIHEVGHQGQRSLGQAYRDGKIGENHPDYVAARVFAANLLTPSGYIRPENSIGHEAYAFQPVEISSNIDGARAVELATKLYGEKPQGAEIAASTTYKVVALNSGRKIVGAHHTLSRPLLGRVGQTFVLAAAPSVR